MQKDFYANKVLQKTSLVLVLVMAVGALVGFFVAEETVLRVVSLGLIALFLWLARTYLNSYYHPALLLQVTENGLTFLPKKKEERRVLRENYVHKLRDPRQNHVHAMEVFMVGRSIVTG